MLGPVMYVNCNMRLNGRLSCLNFILRSVPLRDKEPSDELNLTVLEKEAIERALRRAEGNITRAAELLGITRFTLYRKLEKFGL